ncbi:MAG: phosphatase PAP2 family protein [Actinomycetota bacterium]|nr:phosphatase PAP2 family protein [Actinomycetota bacterium]
MPGLLAMLFTFAMAGFALLVAAVLLYPAFIHWDERLSRAFSEMSVPGFEEFLRALTHMGDTWTMVGLTIAVSLYLLARRMRLEALLLSATVGLGAALGWFFKLIVQRARPGLEYAHVPLPDSYSFPSGHALATFLFFGVIVFLMMLNARSPRVRYGVTAICIGLAALVAVSRVYLGVHWFGDIIASWMLGSAWMVVTVAVYFRYSTDRT